MIMRSFKGSGDQLLMIDSADYELQSRSSVCLQAADRDGLTAVKSFEFDINDVNDAPSEIVASSLFINNNALHYHHC